MTEAEIIWVDVETTGLDPDQDFILEIGVRVTDFSGAVVAEDQQLIYHPQALHRLLNHSSDFVRDIHAQSGLANRYIDLHKAYQAGSFPTTSEVAGVEQSILDLLVKELKLPLKTYPMAGSTVGFDRNFITSWMPYLAEFFNHRNLDVSAIGEACRILNPRIYSLRPQGPAPHRPLKCLDDSIRTFNYYQREFLMVDEALS
jgi:oligoribonuclease